jgi:hypothetical protein
MVVVTAVAVAARANAATVVAMAAAKAVEPTAVASFNLHAPTVRGRRKVRAAAAVQAWASLLVLPVNPVLPARLRVSPIPCAPASI